MQLVLLAFAAISTSVYALPIELASKRFIFNNGGFLGVGGFPEFSSASSSAPVAQKTQSSNAVEPRFNYDVFINPGVQHGPPRPKESSSATQTIPSFTLANSFSTPPVAARAFNYDPFIIPGGRKRPLSSSSASFSVQSNLPHQTPESRAFNFDPFIVPGELPPIPATSTSSGSILSIQTGVPKVTLAVEKRVKFNDNDPDFWETTTGETSVVVAPTPLVEVLMPPNA